MFTSNPNSCLQNRHALSPNTLRHPLTTIPITHQTPIKPRQSNIFYYKQITPLYLKDKTNTQSKASARVSSQSPKPLKNKVKLPEVDLSKKLSIASTTDLQISFTNESLFESPEDLKQNSYQFSFGPVFSSNQSSLKFESVMSSKIGKVSESVLKRQKCQFLQDSIKELKGQEKSLFENKKQIKLIKLIIQFLVANLNSLQGVTHLDIINCLKFLQFSPILQLKNQLDQLINFLMLSIQKDKIPVTMFMRTLFDILDWSFQSFNIYFWLQARLRALQNQIFYERIFPLPQFNQYGVEWQFQQLDQGNINNMNPFLTHFQQQKMTKILSKIEIEQIFTIINNVSDDPLTLTKRSLSFTPYSSLPQNIQTNPNPQTQKLISTNLSPTTKSTPNKFLVKAIIYPKAISLEFQVSQLDNLQQIVAELGSDYFLDGYIRTQFLNQLRKNVSQFTTK